MTNKQEKSMKSIGLVALLFFTFGLVYVDFGNLSFSTNMKAYAALSISLVCFIYYFYLKSKK